MASDLFINDQTVGKKRQRQDDRDIEGFELDLSELVNDTAKFMDLKGQIGGFQCEIGEIEDKVIGLIHENQELKNFVAEIVRDDVKDFEDEKMFGLLIDMEGNGLNKLKEKGIEFDQCNIEEFECLRQLFDQALRHESQKKDAAAMGLKNGCELNLSSIWNEMKELNGIQKEKEKSVVWLLDGENKFKEAEEEESRVGQLSKEIEMLELMQMRGEVGWLDLQKMNQEIEGLKQSEAVAKDMEVKIGEMQDSSWKLKKTIIELKSKKIKEMKGCFETEREERKLKKNEQKQAKDFSLSWQNIVVGLGLVIAAASVVFFGSVKAKAKVKVKKGK